MDAIIKNIKSIWQYKNKVRIDNVAFTLHKITAGILLFFSLLISTAFLVKDPIECINDKTVEHVINAYCWIHATYTLPEKLNRNRTNLQVAHPGVAQYDPEQDEVRVHKYYQWVCFMLFFQAVAFYAPRWLWKNWEERRLNSLVKGMATEDFFMDEEDKEKRKKEVATYFWKVRGSNDAWSAKYALCEILNFINVVVQIDLTDRFLGGALSQYGFSLFQFRRQDPAFRTDALSVVFPTTAKCTFRMIGPSGNIVPYDALCVLSLNLYNQYLYPVLWFWFIGLAVISGLALVYRLAVFLLPELRYQMLRRKFNIPDSELNHIWSLNSELHYGDWYLLYQMGKNMGPLTFLEFLNTLTEFVPSISSYHNYQKNIEDSFNIQNKEKFQ